MQRAMDQDDEVRTALLTGADILPMLPHLARLRITVFREWPYLYDGDPGYEDGYLRDLAASPRAGLVIAFAGSAVVGCSTCLPLEDEAAAVRAPFLERGIDPARVFYFGESVLLPQWRGRGIGVRFFQAREAHARAASACDYAAFCAVMRPADHPLRPPGAEALDAFWRRRGYRAYPDMVCRMRWKQVDTSAKVDNQLSFWIKSLSGAELP